MSETATRPVRSDGGGRVASAGWWSTKVRQLLVHLRARVTIAEREALAGWLTMPELALFDSMHVADQRHGLDVVAALRRESVLSHDVLVAGLLHDAGKGAAMGLWPRVVWSLGEAFGPGVVRPFRLLPGFGRALDRLRDHAAISAELAAAAGCSERTVRLIREQDAPTDPVYGELLHRADEAS